MTFSFSSAGLTIQTYAEVLADVQSEFISRISARVATGAGSFMGQVQRIIALYHYSGQEKTQALYQAMDPRLASGVQLDQRLASLGVTREPATRAEVLGTVTSDADVTIIDGTRVTVGGFVFETIDGPYSRVGAGTIANVRVRSQLYQAIDVSTLGAWTITDAVSGWTAFDDDEQPIAGREEETDAAFRARAEIERYLRATGPLAALDAGVGAAADVSYARAYENVTTAGVDADGIPYGEVNVVVRGGLDADVAAAIEAYGPAGTTYYGTEQVVVGTGARARVVGFDRVADLELHLRVTCTTSTSEDVDQALSTVELEAAIEAALLEFTTASWVIGKDAIPAEMVGAIVTAGIPALDAVLVEVSDDGATWQSTKFSVTIRQQAIYSAARVTTIEN